MAYIASTDAGGEANRTKALVPVNGGKARTPTYQIFCPRSGSWALSKPAERERLAVSRHLQGRAKLD